MNHVILALTLMFIAARVPAAMAQGGPAGNAHPQEALLDSSVLPNPLGDDRGGQAGSEPSAAGRRMATTEKHVFAGEVDLEPLRALPVSHNGRVKTLDTLARETIRSITGRADYLDIVPIMDDAGVVVSVNKLRYDPLFTFFDLLAAPTYYLEKPLIHVTYLPARRAFIETVVDDPRQQERWMLLTRLSPAMISAAFASVAERRGTDPQFARTLEELRLVADVLRLGHNNLLLVAPPEGATRWRHIVELPADASVRQAFARLGGAWRAGDADQVSALISQIAEELSALNSGSVSPSRLAVEVLSNRAHLFDVGAWLYLLAFVALLLSFGTNWRSVYMFGVSVFLLAVLAHAAGFAARWWIAERLPIQNQFESMTGLALGGAIAGLIIMLWKRQAIFAAAGAGVGFLILLAATQTGVPGETIGREAAILNTSWLLKYHVSTVLVSYGLITLGAVVSSLYLAMHYLGRRSSAAELAGFAAQGLNVGASVNSGRRRLLLDLDRAQMTVLQLAFWALGVGILLGAWWADHSWGRWWAFDPKETWALLTWIVYLIVIHVRLGMRGDRGLVTAWLSVAGFIVMLWTYFGVNLLLPGLHAYA